MRILAFLVLLASSLVIGACSSGNSDAPSDTEAHPESWFVDHSVEALATPGFADCVDCHGLDLLGSGEAVSCFSCHSFNTEPPFSIHPPAWTDPFADHRAFAATNGFDSCAACHGGNLRGRQSAPSCFSASFEGLNCHAEGPSDVPHPLDGSYLSGTLHGPDAEADLVVCQACHGELVGPGDNPHFNIGILSEGGTGCESCHGVGYAHPATWGADPSTTFHNNAGNVANACTLCHGVDLDGVEAVGISCFLCHGASPANFPDGCLSCHGEPPNGEDPVGNVSPNRVGQHNRLGHTTLISDTPSLTCRRCHFNAGSGTSIHFDETNPADVVFENPDGTDTVSADSDGTNTTCTGSCHVSGGLIWNHTGSTWY